MKQASLFLALFLFIGCGGDPIPEVNLPAIEAQPAGLSSTKKTPASKKVIEAPTSAPTTQQAESNRDKHKLKCDEGSASDCVALGQQLWFLRSFAASTEAYQKACDAKDAIGCRKLAEHLSAGLGATLDLPRANKLFAESCERKDAASCLALADMIAQGRGASFDATQVQIYLEKSCELKDGDACYRLALRIDRGREAKSDPQQAKLYFETACENKSGFACRKAANYHAEGRLTKEDPDASNELLSKAVLIHGDACHAGSPRDCIALGGLYMSGMGTLIDKERAASAYKTGAQYYDAMCQGGSLDACVELVWLLSRSGPWSLRDKKKSKDLELSLAEKLPAACAASDLESCYQLAIFYATGNGVDEDREKAKLLFQQMCDANLQRGCSGVKRIERKEKLLREAAGEE